MKKFILIQLLIIFISLNMYSEINLIDEYKILWNDLKNHNTIGYKGTYLYTYQMNFSQGSLIHTGNTADLAIEGEGFFKIELINNKYAYTRAGKFIINNQGQLVTWKGNKLIPEIIFPDNFLHDSINISQDGIITCKISGRDNIVKVGILEIYRFVNLQDLVRTNENCFIISDVYVKKLSGQPGYNGFGKIHQGFLEMSNIKIDETVIRMIFILEKLKKQKTDDQNDYDTKIYLLKYLLENSRQRYKYNSSIISLEKKLNRIIILLKKNIEMCNKNDDNNKNNIKTDIDANNLKIILEKDFLKIKEISENDINLNYKSAPSLIDAIIDFINYDYK